MNEKRIQGAIDEVVGGAKSHIGSLTGNTGTQIEGAAQQVKGKIEMTAGELKDAVRDGSNRQDLYGQFLRGY